MRKLVNSLGNLWMPWLLRSPLHFLASGSILLITFTGRKSGKVYTTPVQYARIADALIVFTRRDRVWWKNLRGGAPVTVRLRGQDLAATATPITADADAALMRARAQVMYPRLSPQWHESLVAQSAMIQIQVNDSGAPGQSGD